MTAEEVLQWLIDNRAVTMPEDYWINSKRERIDIPLIRTGACSCCAADVEPPGEVFEFLQQFVNPKPQGH